MAEKKLVGMLLVDYQKDFMPARTIQIPTEDGLKEVQIPAGALGVPGADEDAKRMAAFITKNEKEINNIFATLDSHHTVHIAHPIWWVDAEGNNPAPFTMISKEDIEGDNPKWKCSNEEYQKITEFYITTLSEKGEIHTIWPPHCIIGSDGHAVEETLFEALLKWEQDFKVVEYVHKGSNLFTEHFGAFEAMVPIAGYEDTTFNVPFFEILKKFDILIVGGEASSHCVAATLLQYMEKLTEEEIKKIVYFKDCCSPVPGCEAMEEKFLEALEEAGVTVTTSTEYEL